MNADYDLKKGKNAHNLHDYSCAENTDNANCAHKTMWKFNFVSNFRIMKEVFG
jgi:hypothetical protein